MRGFLLALVLNLSCRTADSVNTCTDLMWFCLKQYRTCTQICLHILCGMGVMSISSSSVYYTESRAFTLKLTVVCFCVDTEQKIYVMLSIRGSYNLPAVIDFHCFCLFIPSESHHRMTFTERLVNTEGTDTENIEIEVFKKSLKRLMHPELKSQQRHV